MLVKTMTSYEQLTAFDVEMYAGKSAIVHPEFSPELQEAVDRFMEHVELEPGDEGYEVTEDGMVLNHYIRKHDPMYYGEKADELEIAFIEKRLGDLDILIQDAGVEFASRLTNKGVQNGQ